LAHSCKRFFGLTAPTMSCSTLALHSYVATLGESLRVDTGIVSAELIN
jgi:hypothetical protein